MTKVNKSIVLSAGIHRNTASAGPMSTKRELANIIAEFKARATCPPVLSDFSSNDFLYQLAVDLYNSGKRAIAALGTTLNLSFWWNESQEANLFDKFNCLMDNSAGRDRPHLTILNTEGLPTLHVFQLSLFDNGVEFNNIPKHIVLEFIEKATSEHRPIDHQTLNLVYYLYAIDKAFEIKMNNPDEALLWFKAAILINPGIPYSYIEAASCLLNKNAFADAEKMYSQIIAILPSAHTPYFRRGECRFMQRNIRGALEDFETALKIKPDFFQAKIDLARVHLKLGAPDKALQMLIADLENMPDVQKAMAYCTIGNIFLQKGEHEEAIAHFEKAAAIDNPQLDTAYNNWGVALDQLGNMPEALEKFNQCLSLNPSHLGANFCKAVILLREGKKDEAIKWCRLHIPGLGQISDDQIISYLLGGLLRG